MATLGTDGRTFRFGAFEASERSGELRKSGVRIRLQQQPFQILVVLLDHAGEVVEREEIRKKLWPDNTFVDFDNAISSAVRKLRDTLGDSAENPRFIETLVRRGYRFIAPVAEFRPPAECAVTTAPAVQHVQAPVRRQPQSRTALIAAVLAAVAALAGIVIRWNAPAWRDYWSGRAIRPARSASARQVRPDAYEAYLKGRYQWSKRTPESLRRAIFYFEQAVNIDHDYALAYAGLAEAYGVLSYNSNSPPKEVYPKTEGAAARALAIDNTIASAHAALGMALANYEWDSGGAERELKRAIALQPQYPSARIYYAGLLSRLGRHQEAIAEARHAVSQDPLSLMPNAALARYYYYARQYEPAIEQCRKTLEIESDFWVAHLFLGKVFVQKKMYREAIAELQRAGQAAAEPRADLAYTYAASGNSDRARGILQELGQLSERAYISPYQIAVIHAGLGENDQAFVWLDKAFQEREPWMAFLQVEPMLDSLRSDSRFRDLLRRIGVA